MNKLDTLRQIKQATELLLQGEPEHRKFKSSQAIAFSGVFSALALVVLFAYSLIGIGTYAGPILAAVVLIPISEEFGLKTGFCSWTAIAILATILMPDRELALFFICFGWFPLVIRPLYKIKSRLLRTGAEVLIYLIMVSFMYGVLCALLGIDPELSQNTKIMNAALLILGGVTFVLCDFVYSRLTLLWIQKWRKRFRRLL